MASYGKAERIRSRASSACGERHRHARLCGELPVGAFSLNDCLYRLPTEREREVHRPCSRLHPRPTSHALSISHARLCTVSAMFPMHCLCIPGPFLCDVPHTLSLQVIHVAEHQLPLFVVAFDMKVPTKIPAAMKMPTKRAAKKVKKKATAPAPPPPPPPFPPPAAPPVPWGWF